MASALLARSPAPVRAGRRPSRSLEPWRDWAVIAIATHAVLITVAVTDPHGWALFIAALPLGAAFAVGTLTVLHDAGHRMFGSRAWVNAAAVQLSTPGGLWAGHWTLKHRMHHKLSQVYPYDEATRSSSLIRLHQAAASNRWQRYQHVSAWFVYCLAWVGELRSQLRYLRTGVILGTETPGTWSRIGSFVGEKAFWLLILSPYALALGVGRLALLIIAAETVASLLAALILVVGHINQGLVASTERPDGGWTANLVRSTASFQVESVPVRMLTGGMTHHLAHHLRPTAVRSELPELHRTVAREAAEKTGLPLVVYPTLRQAVTGHYRRLRELSVPD